VFYILSGDDVCRSEIDGVATGEGHLTATSSHNSTVKRTVSRQVNSGMLNCCLT